MGFVPWPSRSKPGVGFEYRAIAYVSRSLGRAQRGPHDPILRDACRTFARVCSTGTIWVALQTEGSSLGCKMTPGPLLLASLFNPRPSCHLHGAIYGAVCSGSTFPFLRCASCFRGGACGQKTATAPFWCWESREGAGPQSSFSRPSSQSSASFGTGQTWKTSRPGPRDGGLRAKSHVTELMTWFELPSISGRAEGRKFQTCIMRTIVWSVFVSLSLSLSLFFPSLFYHFFYISLPRSLFLSLSTSLASDHDLILPVPVVCSSFSCCFSSFSSLVGPQSPQRLPPAN